MGKTYKKNGQFKPKKRGQVFIKDKPWKHNKTKSQKDDVDIVDPTTDIRLDILK